MDFPAHERAQSAVDELMTLQGTLAHELRGNDHGFEVRVVIGCDVRLSARQSGFDELLDLCGIHAIHPLGAA
jgi:hypothetical protein